MLRNAVVHIANEQPFMADLVYAPTPGDVSLICRNMRTMNGTKPVFVDFADSTFLLPIAQVRFIEIPAASYEEAAAAEAADGAEPADGAAERPGLALVPGSADGVQPEAESTSSGPIEDLDHDLLRRIREA